MFCRSTRRAAVIPHLPLQPNSSMAAWTDFIPGKFYEPKISGTVTVPSNMILLHKCCEVSGHRKHVSAHQLPNIINSRIDEPPPPSSSIWPVFKSTNRPKTVLWKPPPLVRQFRTLVHRSSYRQIGVSESPPLSSSISAVRRFQAAGSSIPVSSNLPQSVPPLWATPYGSPCAYARSCTKSQTQYHWSSLRTPPLPHGRLPCRLPCMFPHAPPQPNVINTPPGDAAACPTAPLPNIIICAASPPLFLSRPHPTTC